MANTRALVQRRKAVANTRKITKTMEQISTAKLARAQNAALAARPYARGLRALVADLAAASREKDDDEAPPHPLLRSVEAPKRATLIVFVSDRGLCGSFNAGILRLAEERAAALEQSGCTVEYVLHGKKALAYFRRRKAPTAKTFVGVSDKPSYARAAELSEEAAGAFASGKLDLVEVVYPAFRSAASQKPTVKRVLPFAPEKEPAGEKNEAGKPPAAKESTVDYLYHPEPRQILAGLLPSAVKLELFSAMLETTAGEHAARRAAMKNATDAADKMIKMLTRKYNRARQGKITQEIAEIVGGVNALS